jgi:NAD(P)-dependent dehydrogenase (short-subunit alcohol dehydrogenase family)
MDMTRSVIVTGGFGVLGQAVAEAFAREGDKVARIDYAAEARSSLPGALDIGGVDLTDAASTQNAIGQVVAAHQGIDVLVNVAGGFAWETVESGSIATFVKMNTMNLLTAATITQLALPALKASSAGRIINIGAGGAVTGTTGMGAYAASKSGLHRFTEALADELSGTGVTVNAILPSIIDTPTNRADMPDSDFSRWVSPQAAAKVIVLLASEAAGAVSGALIPVSRAG